MKPVGWMIRILFVEARKVKDEDQKARTEKREEEQLDGHRTTRERMNNSGKMKTNITERIVV